MKFKQIKLVKLIFEFYNNHLLLNQGFYKVKLLLLKIPKKSKIKNQP